MNLISPSIRKVMLKAALRRKEQLESMMDMDNWNKTLSLELDKVNQYIAEEGD